ncbi:MAG: radical SAM protein [Treponema sp.]|nr:radical SAM protein [Treponema sp.]
MSISRYEPCFLCPRRCGVMRESAEGYCGERAALRIACASIHRGEEPPLTGAGENGSGGGSGTIFVSGCNLGCVFCQNHQISQTPAPNDARHHLGRVVTTAEFAQICLALQDRGAENINIVTGSHAVLAIVEGIAAAKARGLSLPVLWNSSAYELPETLELLCETVDVFLPDMKTFDSLLAARYFNAPDYPAAAAAAIETMLGMKPLRFNERKDSPALMSGVMVRHLVLPGRLPASRAVLRWFADVLAGRALLSLMFQYTPVKSPAEPDRYITRKEYDEVLGWLTELEIEDGYCQEFTPGNTDWLPDFNRPNPFPSNLSVPVWHWKKGFVP